MALTSRTAPPPAVPVSEEETQFYMNILRNYNRYDENDRRVEQLLLNYDGDYPKRAPDSFIQKAIIYMGQRPIDSEDIESMKRYIKNLINSSCNTDTRLRKIYAFWKERCNSEITNDVRCFMVMDLVHQMARSWALHSDIAKRKFVYSLMAPDEYLPYYPVANQDDLVDQLREFLFHPDRVKRLTIDYIKEMVEPACEN